MYTEIKTFDDACKALGYNNTLPDFSTAPEKHKKAFSAHYQLVIIAEAINEGWQPDWNDEDQYKYELYPDVVVNEKNASGFGLSYDDYVYWRTSSDVGSRLCFESREKARHCFDTFLQLWEDYMLIDK